MDDRAIVLLEEIAFRLSLGTLEKPEYLRRLYASSQPSAATLHGSGAGPKASGQENQNRHERIAAQPLRGQQPKKPAAPQKDDRGKVNHVV